MNTNISFNEIQQKSETLIEVIKNQKDQVSANQKGASQKVQQQGHTFKTALSEKITAKTVEIVQKEFLEMTKDFSQNLESKTSSEIQKYYELSGNIITLTKEILAARKGHDKPPSKLQLLAAKVFCSIPFVKIFYKETSAVSDLEKSLAGLKEQVGKLDSTNRILINDCGCSEELSAEIQTLGDPVKRMIDRINQLRTHSTDQSQLKEAVDTLKSYVNRLKDSQKELNLSLHSAASYVALGEVFHNETMPHLASKNILEAKQAEIEGEFQFQVEERRKGGSLYVNQFSKDIPRANTFKRSDPILQIKDPSPFPSKSTRDLSLDEERNRKLSEADSAINQLIIEGDQDWQAPLQLAVTQSSLNQAFASAKVQLAQDGVDVTWKDLENDKDYYLITGLSDELPPAEIEIIRNPETKQIDRVNVSVQGSLNFYKGADSSDENKQIVLKDAVRASLSYTIELNKERLPVISDFKCNLESKILPLPATKESEVYSTPSTSKAVDSNLLIKNRRLSSNFDTRPPNRRQ